MSRHSIIDDDIIKVNCLVASWICAGLDVIAVIIAFLANNSTFLILAFCITIIFVLFIGFICKLNRIVDYFRGDLEND